MPRLADLGVHPMSAPGLTPGVLGLVLACLGLVLLVQSARSPAPNAEEGGGEGGWGRLAVTLAFCFAYAAVLLGRVPFWLATALFVGVFVLTFTFGRSKARALGMAAALAVATAASVTFLFQQVFLVQLP